ncbi:hypothetical protein Droror1_Dr00011124 [Drosera rotundifolia]
MSNLCAHVFTTFAMLMMLMVFLFLQQLEIIEIMLKACDALEDYIKKCKAMVFEYGPVILTNAEKFLESNDLCATLHAYASSTTEETSQDLSDSKILMVTSASS